MRFSLLPNVFLPLPDTMNKFRIVIELETYSESPEDWVTESIVDQLETDETIHSLTVERVDS